MLQSYPNHDVPVRTHGTYSTSQSSGRKAGDQYEDINSHDAEVLRSRGIAPWIAKAAGIRTISGQEAKGYGHRPLSGLLIPSHNTQGEIDRYQLRPHDPPADDKGRPRKYLWATGCRQSLYVPPQSLKALRDIDATVLITEAPLKALAIAAALETEGIEGVAVVAVAGVYGWRSEGMPLSDHADIPWRRKEGERIRHRRRVIILFDSDALTNPSVTRARWEYAQYLRRRGAKVECVDVPAADDGGKQGIDDALAVGHTLRSLVRTAYPAPDIMPAIDPETAAADPELSELETLRTENASLRQLVSAQARLITNPMLKDKERAIGYRAITVASQRRKSGAVGADGRPRVSASELSGDYRSRPQKGESLPATNPDGSHPITRRQNVKSILATLTTAGVLSVGTEPATRKAANGDTYTDTDFVVEVEDMAASIVRLANYRIEKQRKPYTKQDPCPHCGKVHERTVIRQTVCGSEDDPGCGAIIRETIVTLPIPPASDPAATPEERERLEESTAAAPVIEIKTGSPKNGEAKDVDISAPSPAPRNYSSPKNGEPDSGGLITDAETGCPVDTESGEIVGLETPAAPQSPPQCEHPGCTESPENGRSMCEAHIWQQTRDGMAAWNANNRARKAAQRGEAAS